MDELDQLFSREEVLAGLHGRRASQIFSAIERRTAYLITLRRRALEILLGKKLPHEYTTDFLHQLRYISLEARAKLTIAYIEEYADRWVSLAPDTPQLCAAVSSLLARKYKFTYEDIPNIREALGLDNKEVQDAYEALYRKPISTIFSEQTLVDTNQDDPFTKFESMLKWISLPKGETLFHQGDSGDSLFILIHGRLRIATRLENSATKTTSEIGPGEIIGEFGIIMNDSRMSTVYAIRDATLLQLERSAFEHLARENPEVPLQIARSAIAHTQQPRLQSQHNSQSLATIAVVPINPELSCTDFCSRLVASLQKYDRTLHLDQAYIEDELGRGSSQTDFDDPENGMVVAWLSEQEMHYRYIVYQADYNPSVWTDRSLRQADHVLFVGWANGDSALSEVEQAIVQRSKKFANVQHSLVLLHPDGERRPKGTMAWLRKRHVECHYHIRLDRNDDFERLARTLTGRAVGLVLSGGAAWGLAHIGAIRALAESGIPIDMVGGNSMGSIIAATVALGWDPEYLLHEAQKLGTSAIIDLTLPMVAITKGHKRAKLMKKQMGDGEIEDLWIPYFCTTSNLTKSKRTIHRTGPLWKGVTASSAIGGIMPPCVYDGDLHIDGMYFSNLPIDVMQDWVDGGSIIAVDVGGPLERLPQTYPFETEVSGWKVLWNRLNPFVSTSDMPNVISILIELGLVNSKAKRRRSIEQALVELYIAPSLEDFLPFDFDSSEGLANAGYQAAMAAIAALPPMPGRLGR